MTDKLWEDLNVDPPPKKTTEIVPIPEEVPSEGLPLEDDFEASRKSLRRILQKGEKALDEIACFASNDQSPKSYEAVATLVKTLSDTAKSLIDLHHTKMKIEHGPSQAAAYNTMSKQRALEETTPSISVEKAVFIGNNRDLIAQLKGKSIVDPNDTEKPEQN